MHSFLLIWNIATYTWSIISFICTPTEGKLHGKPISRYIVEYQNPSQLVRHKEAYFRDLLDTHLKSNNISVNDITPLNEAPELFSGISLTVHNPEGAKKLRAASFIKVCPIFSSLTDSGLAIYPVLSVSRPVFLQTPKVLNNLTEGSSADLFEPHLQVGISRLHDKGYRCKGINIAVIDTGCDCQHPALGKGFGPGFKIAKGYDFVGDAYNGTTLPKPDNNPCTPCAVSTNCMALISWAFYPPTKIQWASEEYAQRQRCPLTGFLDVRKILTMSWLLQPCSEHIRTAVAIAVFDFAADVFSLSVGAPGGWAGGSIAAVIASRIAHRRAVIVSAGNLGEEGMFFSTSPSTGTGTISVGSVQSTALVSYSFTTSATGSRTFNYFATFTIEAGTFPVYPISSIKRGLDDACKPLPADLPNLSKHIVLVRRSQTHACTLETQLGNLLKKGTQRVLWTNVCAFLLPLLSLNNSSPEYVARDASHGVSVGVVTREIGTMLREMYFDNPGKLSVTISQDFSIAQGMFLQCLHKSHPHKRHLHKKILLRLLNNSDHPEHLRFTQLLLPIVEKSAPSPISEFSYCKLKQCRKLTQSLLVGQCLISNLPSPGCLELAATSYAIASGTSISAPQVSLIFLGKMAGIAALIISAQGKGINPHEIYTRIASSSTPVLNYTGSGILESVCHQGAGLVNAWCAAMATTVVSTHSFSLNDTLHFNGTQPLSIVNKGKHPVSYTVDHVTAGTALALDKHNIPNPWPVPLIPGTAVVSFSVDKFVLNPGQTFKLQVKFRAPSGLDELTLPVYSGFVMLKTGTECESHTIPYYGVGAALKKRPGNLFPRIMLDYGYSYQENYTLPALDSGLTGLPVKEYHRFTLQGLDLPVIEYRLAFGTPLILFHLVQGDTAIPPSLLPLKTARDPKSNPTLSTSPPPQIPSKADKTDSHQHSRLFTRAEYSAIKRSSYHAIPDDFPGRITNEFRDLRLLGSIKSYETLQRWRTRHGCVSISHLADAASIAFTGEVFDLSVPDYQHAKPKSVPDGNYRILVRSCNGRDQTEEVIIPPLYRALRVTGNPQDENDYEAWISPVFSIRRSKPPTQKPS
ncbi:hypothetical protein VP01_684g4 [Puccinia sorghi]|uniref:Peptidase S8/S53 domain-containing protein n=1 Tax=Puccinia sorghi TaxID=27349 RepID=A0A0L6UEC4_9BASI|nr:hypothetical protein VP01_684g4 [Puccinia sorghi]